MDIGLTIILLVLNISNVYNSWRIYKAVKIINEQDKRIEENLTKIKTMENELTTNMLDIEKMKDDLRENKK